MESPETRRVPEQAFTDDPFVDVQYNGTSYHLSQGVSAGLATLQPLQPVRRTRRSRNQASTSTNSFMGLSLEALQQQAAGISGNAPAVSRGRHIGENSRGRGRGIVAQDLSVHEIQQQLAQNTAIAVPRGRPAFDPLIHHRSRSPSPLQRYGDPNVQQLIQIDDEQDRRPGSPGGFELDQNVEQDNNPLAQPPQQGLPPAMLPVENENDDQYAVFNLGPMNIECSKCHALHFLCERKSDSSETNPKFGTCCLNGKITLPMLAQPPPELAALYFGRDPDSPHFLSKIRYYNSAFAMASLGVKIDRSVTGTGGPQVFKIQGGLYHNHGQLLPNEDGSVKYAQIYFFDFSEQQLDIREANNRTTQLKRHVLSKIQVCFLLRFNRSSTRLGCSLLP